MSEPSAPDEPSDEELAAEQRREHVRVQLLRRCSVVFRGQGSKTAELIDLSGTGCGFLVRAEPQVGDPGRVRIEFDDWTLDAPIVARYVRPDETRRTYVGASFDAMPRSETERVIKEVFAQMRRQLRHMRRGE